MRTRSPVTNVIVRIAKFITPFDPEFLEWSREQEHSAREEAAHIRRQNAIEADILSRKQTQGSRP